VRDAGIREHHIDPTLFSLSQSHDGIGVGRIPHIQMMEFGLATRSSDRRSSVPAFLVENICQDHAVPGACEGDGGGSANADSGSSD
jgi:hypothetical protein